MSTKTTGYGLIKPELTDAADITAYNDNWDIIDEQFLTAAEAIASHTSHTNNPHGVTAEQIGAQPRISYGTTEPTGGTSGDIYIQYEA